MDLSPDPSEVSSKASSEISSPYLRREIGYDELVGCSDQERWQRPAGPDQRERGEDGLQRRRELGAEQGRGAEDLGVAGCLGYEADGHARDDEETRGTGSSKEGDPGDDRSAGLGATAYTDCEHWGE